MLNVWARTWRPSTPAFQEWSPVSLKILTTPENHWEVWDSTRPEWQNYQNMILFRPTPNLLFGSGFKWHSFVTGALKYRRGAKNSSSLINVYWKLGSTQWGLRQPLLTRLHPPLHQSFLNNWKLSLLVIICINATKLITVCMHSCKCYHG